ncbi:bifunctional diaminohydroxyphosphoribosylaminopyrimidine deaminase/5-amino-6-(5-phosphoribosylamino)uracil reductase RibD [soil metagenome]
MPAAAGPRDSAFMLRALELSRNGWGRVSPNPLVGAVIVKDGVVIGEGWHSEYGRAHAEVEALRAAGADARGASLYVTLEPCSHHGKTPPCSEAVIASGIRRLVYAARDPNPRARGGAERLREHGIEVQGGVEEDAAMDLNGPFFHALTNQGAPRPWIELKLALSLDSRVADQEGRSAWITGRDARAEVHRIRAGHDAIAVGIGTVLADDPLLTVRGSVEPRLPPTRVVFDRKLRIPPSSRLLSSLTEAPLLIVHGPEAPPAVAESLKLAGIELIPATTLHSALASLTERGIGSLFCEGGAELASTLLRENVVDRLTLFYAPVLLGPEGRSPFSAIPSSPMDQVLRWRTLHRATFGADTMITFAR